MSSDNQRRTEVCGDLGQITLTPGRGRLVYLKIETAAGVEDVTLIVDDPESKITVNGAAATLHELIHEALDAALRVKTWREASRYEAALVAEFAARCP